jgi:hypothetical protein
MRILVLHGPVNPLCVEPLIRYGTSSDRLGSNRAKAMPAGSRAMTERTHI